jgi:hypothetical protein
MTLKNLPRSLKITGLLGVASVAIAAAWVSHGGVGVAVAAPARDDARPAQVAGDPYTVKTEVVGDCKAGAECTAKITLNVTEPDFHVNDQYPFKFTAAAEGVEFKGAGGNVFHQGDFVREKKTATMTVKFKPANKGSLTITGKYKICVCSEKVCQPQTIDVSIPVLVK